MLSSKYNLLDVYPKYNIQLDVHLVAIYIVRIACVMDNNDVT